jgi:hypothetical protein
MAAWQRPDSLPVVREFHFVTFSCYAREPNLGARSAREIFERSLEAMRSRYQFVIASSHIVGGPGMALASKRGFIPLFEGVRGELHSQGLSFLAGAQLAPQAPPRWRGAILAWLFAPDLASPL